MNQFAYDVAAAYRIYYKMSRNPPPVFPDSKFKLAELCFNSFKNSLGGLRVKLWVILNDCPPEYEDMIRRVWGSEGLVVLKFPGVTNGTTLNEASIILREQTDAEIVYFSDDDYVYLPGQFPRAVEFLKQNADVDFIALYDHPDAYTTDLHKLPSKTKMSGGQKWNTCLSTTHTFLTKRSVLIEIKRLYVDMYRSFKDKGPFDLGFWMALTKQRVFNPVKFLHWVLVHRWYWAFSTVIAWNHCWRQILFGRRYTLWVPRPTLATHMDAKLLATGVDWQQEFQNQITSIKTAVPTD
jgi:hypothetical protein